MTTASSGDATKAATVAGPWREFEHCLKCITWEDCAARGACYTGGKVPSEQAFSPDKQGKPSQEVTLLAYAYLSLARTLISGDEIKMVMHEIVRLSKLDSSARGDNTELLGIIRHNESIDEHGDPVGAKPETQWELGYAAGIRCLYRFLSK